MRLPTQPPELHQTLSRLPGPGRWAETEARLAELEAAAATLPQRQRLRLGRWLLAELQGKRAEVLAEIETARGAGELSAQSAQVLVAALGRNEAADTETRLSAFEADLAEKAKQGRYAKGKYFPRLETPDLVTLLGEAEAEAVLRKALLEPVELQLASAAEPTLKLARRVALELAPLMNAPQWSLVGPMEVSLYEAMWKRFGAGEREHDYQRDNARASYVVGLILADRAEDALREARAAGDRFSLPYHNLGEQLGRGGYEEPVRAFLHRFLTETPTAPDGAWTSYRRLAVQTGKTDEMFALIREQGADESLDGEARVRAIQRLAMAELAVDDVAAGLPRLREALAAARELPEEARKNFARRLALSVAKVGFAIEDSSAAREGAEALEAEFKAMLGRKAQGYEVTSAMNEAMGVWVRLGEQDRAFALADDLGTWAVAARAQMKAGNYEVYVADDVEATPLKVRLGVLVGREAWDEAHALLTGHEGWGVRDAAQLIGRDDGFGSDDRVSFGVLVARVLAARGDQEGARRALETALVLNGGADDAHEAYVDLLGEAAIPLLDLFLELDPYEERPLIWKAVLASRAGDHVEAERLARAAIAIDPSDGEQGRGDRMRVYAVLGAARAAQGDAEQAEFFARVVRAIRLSEEADQWHEAGLFARSLDGYRRALEFFADAYCVQSRLALRLAESGRMEEAIEHYRRAYELMPDSFGRVESHCFGCEKAFAGEEQQSIAEKVFTRMAESDPKKPQVPYLLGYLRDEQRRLPEAAELYARATTLDPLYLNAWKKQAALAERMAVSAERRDEIALRLVELDPLGRHASPNLSKVVNVAALWDALAKARERTSLLPKHASVLPLMASAARLQKAGGRDSVTYSNNGDGRDPGQIFARRPFAQAIDRVVMEARFAR